MYAGSPPHACSFVLLSPPRCWRCLFRGADGPPPRTFCFSGVNTFLNALQPKGAPEGGSCGATCKGKARFDAAKLIKIKKGNRVNASRGSSVKVRKGGRRTMPKRSGDNADEEVQVDAIVAFPSPHLISFFTSFPQGKGLLKGPLAPAHRTKSHHPPGAVFPLE